ncbi:MAG: ABC transporter permease [Gaiellaceae bacterium]
MRRVALKGVAGRKLRAALTTLAVVLGVAMVSGTFVFTDTIEKAIDTLLTEAYTGSDAVVSGRDVVELSAGGRPTLPAELLAHVRALPEVEAASGSIGADAARLLDANGKPISTHEQAVGFSIDAGEPRFNPLRLTDGGWPAGSAEVAIDAATAAKHGFAVGETIAVAGPGPVRRFTISGIAQLTTLDSIGGLTLAIFDVPTAQAFFGRTGRFDEILVAAKEGVSPEELVQAIRPILPASAEVATGEAEVASQAEGTNEDIALVRKFMLAFGGLALFVGAFVIFNTLSTTVAQRTRELATLRTLGASRRQLLGSVVLESLVIGAVGSAIGFLLGPALAKGLNALFVALGEDLPEIGAVIATRTVVVSVLAGVLITLVTGLFPALRATSVPPIAAVREGSLPTSPLAPYVPYVAGASIAVGVGLLAFGMFAGALSVTWVLLLLALGCLVLFVGVALISSRLVKPLASILAWPTAQVAGAAGRLARQNSVRNPGRTAATASALMIGLALVTFVAVLGQGLRSSLGDAVERVVRADYVVTSDDGFGPLTPEAASALASQPGVETVSGVRQDSASVFGSDESVAGVDPGTIAAVVRFDWDEGSDATLAELGARGAVLQRDFAEEHDLGVGSRFSVETAQGKRLELTVRGIHTPPKLDPILGPILVSQQTFDSSFERPQDVLALVDARGEPSDEKRTALEQALRRFPEVKLQTKAEFADVRQKEIKDLLSVLYVLLSLSMVVSLFGMVNTVVLSVFERTRELGMLRAIGMTRRQARRMVRHESVITALIGAALGLPLGIALAALVTQALVDEGVAFSLPLAPLVVFALIAVGAGLLAAALPARRASRLNVLEALQYE